MEICKKLKIEFICRIYTVRNFLRARNLISTLRRWRKDFLFDYTEAAKRNECSNVREQTSRMNPNSIPNPASSLPKSTPSSINTSPYPTVWCTSYASPSPQSVSLHWARLSKYWPSKTLNSCPPSMPVPPPTTYLPPGPSQYTLHEYRCSTPSSPTHEKQSPYSPSSQSNMYWPFRAGTPLSSSASSRPVAPPSQRPSRPSWSWSDSFQTLRQNHNSKARLGRY